MESFSVPQQFIRGQQGLRGLPVFPNCLGEGFSSSQVAGLVATVPDWVVASWILLLLGKA